MQHEPGSAADIYDQQNLPRCTPTSYAWLQYDYSDKVLFIAHHDFQCDSCHCTLWLSMWLLSLHTM